YNYGTFNSFTEGFIVKFLRGKLPYTLTVNTYGNFLREYNYYERAVIEQIFALSPQEKVAVIQFLRNNAKPENAEYMYDFFFDNCSSRVTDVLEASLDRNIIYPDDDGLTYRQMIQASLVRWPWTRFGIDLIIGSKADQLTGIRGQMFLPDHLSKILSSS